MYEAIKETYFHFPGQTGLTRGKVRDIYYIKDQYLLLVATDRISAFDVILPRAIPYKGEILNQIASKNLALTRDIVSNWLIDTPDPAVTFGYRCEPYPVEMVIRGYLCGHAWREYKSGKRTISGVSMPDGMKQNDPFPDPIITPATKAESGHDEDISREAIIERGLVQEKEYKQLETYTRQLFKRGAELAASRGLILADTKYEFGKRNGEIFLIDEVHTPDSSRYFYAEGFWDNQEDGTPQKQLSKEFVREWLMDNGYQGLEGQQMPEMTDEVVKRIMNRYEELFQQLMGEKFQFSDRKDVIKRVQDHCENALNLHI